MPTSSMTWDEFKKLVDDELARKGCDGTLPVTFIRVDRIGLRQMIEVHVEEHEPALVVWTPP